MNTPIDYESELDAAQVLDPSIRKVWAIKLALAGSVLVLVALVYDLVNLFAADRALPFGVLSGTVALVFAGAAVWLPGIRHRFWRYRLTDDELYLERGVINRVRTIVPLRRIQHLDVSQDIVEREFELGRLVVHTAGTRSSTVVLPGLKMEDAERLRDQIRLYIVDDAL